MPGAAVWYDHVGPSAPPVGAAPGQLDQRLARDWWLLLAASLSLSADAAVIVATACALNLRRAQPMRILMYFAISDALSQAVLLLAILVGPLHGAMCSAEAAISWWAIWTSWLWLCCFAFVVQTRFYHSAHSALTSRRIQWIMVACWAGPLVVAVAAALGGAFAPRDELPVCSLVRNVWIRASAHGASTLIVLYNAYAFVRVLIYVRRTLNMARGVLPEEEQAAIQEKLRLWPRFASYLLAFVMTQTPVAVVSIANGAYPLIPHDSFLWTSTMFLSYMHGFANGLVHLLWNWSEYKKLMCARHIHERRSNVFEDLESPDPRPLSARLMRGTA